MGRVFRHDARLTPVKGEQEGRASDAMQVREGLSQADRELPKPRLPVGGAPFGAGTDQPQYLQCTHWLRTDWKKQERHGGYKRQRLEAVSQLRFRQQELWKEI